MNSIFRLPFPNRYSELTEYIDKSAVKELENLYPDLITEIFNVNIQSNWGLRTLKPDTNYSSFHAVYNFLSPNGPIFKLCYKLLLDCHLRYEFPYQYLPTTVRNRLEDNNDTSLYKQKLLSRSKTQAGNCLYLNAFEYYMFHFAYHLINPTLQLPEENTLEWDTVYLRLVETYLDHFLPCASSLVYPLLHHSSSSMNSQHTIESISPTRNSASIFREDVLKKMSPSPPPYTRTKTSSSAEIWRSELVATLFLDFWLSSGTSESRSTSFLTQRMWSIDVLPSKEQLRCVRLLLKHLHYFSNYLLPEDCAMNDLKREIIRNNRRTIYTFFSNVMTQLPLDSSFKILLEAWFTYIQPWRYTNPYSKNMKYSKHENNLDSKWFTFIAENLVVYTHLYYIVLTRLSRCDLTTYKISSMSCKLTQIFSMSSLLNYIEEAENYLEEGRQGHINTWNSIIRQNIYCVEKLDFRYDGFHSQSHKQQVIEFVKQIEDSIPTLKIRKNALLTDENGGFVKWFREQLSGNVRCSSAEEIQRIEYYLSQTLHNLYNIHKIDRKETSTSNVSILNYMGRNRNESCSSFGSFDSTDGNLSTSSSSPLADPKERRKSALSFTYEGDPDLSPIRSWENKFLVRVLYYICLWINTQFNRDLKRMYFEDSISGGIARQILCPPKSTYYFEKRYTPDGYSRRVKNILPPRISFRWCGSYYYLGVFFVCYLLIRMFDLSPFKFTSVISLLYILYLTANSIFYPIPVPSDDDNANSSR
ncbi:sphingomyelin phosphodiesterase 4 [Planococcus citri]|uniref:sphingomyelin phosphodiesterase 4 n=1 Tax=Planococcus citri TaxID=170843 RepID=UPI0031F911C2